MAKINEFNKIPVVRPEGGGSEEIYRFEQIRTQIYTSAEEAVEKLADYIASQIREKKEKNENLVLGLVTGSTPKPLYKRLIQLHKEGLSFENVITFNVDEYYPIEKTNIKSYYNYMNDTFFSKVDFKPENINFLDSEVSIEDIKGHCNAYDEKISACGGIDIQILGLGKNGHVGFNEPGTSMNSLTHRVRLDRTTRIDIAGDFFGVEHTPETALTMGVGSIMKAKEIFLMAWGEEKANQIKNTVQCSKDAIPASFLKNHDNCTVLVDVAAAHELTRIKTPWLVGECEWNDRLVRAAVVWLCQTTNKAILKLTDADYSEHGLSHLIAEVGSASSINIRVFNDLQHTITGWPGGKPNADDTTRPERANPYPKRVIVFSPHPDDDVISMGGTFARLQENGHNLHVAYQTSGNIAVSDDFALRYMDTMYEHQKMIKSEGFDEINALYKKIKDFILNKKPGEKDIEEVKHIKTIIRQAECKSADRYLNVKEENIHFLNLPFYETGGVKKNPPGQKDIDIIKALIQEVKPHQIFAAGDLADPHGTHKVCIEVLIEALEQLKNEDWFKDCNIWLYRGAWQEWPIEQVDMAVPLSPKEVLIKRTSIFKHQSQKDGAMFPGSDEREFWQRAEDRTEETARIYNQLGMAEYQAMELFAKLDI
jgi:glucosamine-6-phosphate deaminase